MQDINIEEDNLELLLLRIRSKYSSFTSAAKKIADYILINYEKTLYLNITELAKECKVSESTVTKFVRNIGYNGFQEIKICLARNSYSNVEKNQIYEELSLNDNIKSICTKVYNNNIEALKDSLKILDFDSVDKAAQLILKARRVDFYGMGSSTVATLNAKMRLYRLGIMCFTYNDFNEQIVSASLLKAGDVAVGISNSGKSPDIVRALEIAKQSKAFTICITNHDDTPITEFADIKLFTLTKDSEELSESLNSRIAEISLIDALYICIASKMKKQAIIYLHKTSQAIRFHKLNSK